MTANIGVYGLGVMGANLARNFASRGHTVAVFNRNSEVTTEFDKNYAHEGKFISSLDLKSFIDSLEAPKRVVMMVPAGAATDAVIEQVLPLLSQGDILIDAGNSHYEDTRRREERVRPTGVLYFGVGVSGGEEGALKGPALMPGGSAQAWPLVRPFLQAIAAKADDGQPCCEWMGPGGAGHFVKMVHNGIEYADMQTICEAYWLMHHLLGMSPAEMSAVFREWNQGELSSYLIDITADILAHTDPETGDALVNLILDTAEQKGTGKWASQIALDLGVTAPTIANAVFARTVSALHTERAKAAHVLPGPAPRQAGQRGQLGPAGLAPGGPDIEQPDLSAHRFRPDRLIRGMQLRQHKCRCRPVNQRRRHLARIETQTHAEEHHEHQEDAQRDEEFQALQARAPRAVAAPCSLRTFAR